MLTGVYYFRSRRALAAGALATKDAKDEKDPKDQKDKVVPTSWKKIEVGFVPFPCL